MANISITIPQKSEGSRELVAISRKEYEGLLRFYNVQHQQAPKKKVAKKEPKLSRGLRQALKEVEEGKISRAYTDVNELIKALHA